MKTEELKRFAEDLRQHTGLSVALELDDQPDGLHILTLNGVDFFFHADGSGYDGWGKPIVPGFSV